jgi:hypothetical protein
MSRLSRFRPKAITPEQERLLRQYLLDDGMTRCEAAAAVGITRQLLDSKLRNEMKDVRVGRGRRGRTRRPEIDPDEDEIARRAAEIRARWTPEEEQERRTNFSGPVDGA